jgi:phosphate transport system substrate-binding protein
MDKAAVESGAYPISRPLYMATNGKPKGDAAQFLSWIVGSEGQTIVEREGFFPIGEGKYKTENDKAFK